MGTAISCICLGGFGVNFINRVYTYNKDIKFISINDDTHHKCMATIKLNSWKKIIDLIKSGELCCDDIYFLIVNLGGSWGGEVQKIYRKLQVKVKYIIVIACMPFSFEIDNANRAAPILESLQNTIKYITIFYNDKYLNGAQKGTIFCEVLRKIDEDIIYYIRNFVSNLHI